MSSCQEPYIPQENDLLKDVSFCLLLHDCGGPQWTVSYDSFLLPVYSLCLNDVYVMFCVYIDGIVYVYVFGDVQILRFKTVF